MRKYIILSFILVLIDLISKFIVHSFMPYGQPVNILGSFLRFTYIENHGMAFGLFSNHFSDWFLIKNIVFTVLACILIVIIFKEIKNSVSKVKQVSLFLIIGGALGNLIERIFGNIIYFFKFSIPFGRVVDFIDIGIGKYRWFIFNMADVFISLGIIILIFHMIFIQNTKLKEKK